MFTACAAARKTPGPEKRTSNKFTSMSKTTGAAKASRRARRGFTNPTSADGTKTKDRGRRGNPRRTAVCVASVLSSTPSSLCASQLLLCYGDAGREGYIRSYRGVVGGQQRLDCGVISISSGLGHRTVRVDACTFRIAFSLALGYGRTEEYSPAKSRDVCR